MQSLKEFLDLIGLTTFVDQLKHKFGSKTTLDQCEKDRNENLLNIDYDSKLAFNKNEIIKADESVANNAPYVGSATVGYTYVA